MSVIRKFKAKQHYEKQYAEFRKLVEKSGSSDFVFGDRHPCLKEANTAGGNAKGHYFHQDLLVAQKIFKNNPQKHVDFGSSVEGFVAHVASYREIEVFDFRPTESNATNIVFKVCDLMRLDPAMENYCDSISSLHAIEHMGLGRYGDPLNPNGHIDALDNIYRILKPGGRFYFSVPMGLPQRIEYNAHRVFSLDYLTKLFAERYETVSLSYVDDPGDVHTDIAPSMEDINSSYGCRYGCGIFELIKK